MTAKNSKPSPGGNFRFRVSDSLAVPLRGHMLRLRLLDGTPSMKDLRPGRAMRVASPAGRERTIRIIAHSATAGRAAQDRLDRMGELDVIISAADAETADGRIEIGWIAAGPAS